MEVTLYCKESDSGNRVDKYICAQCETLTRSSVQRLMEQGHILVNGKIENKKYLIKKDDVVDIHEPTPQPLDAVAQNIPLEIVYEDAYLLVVNKPQGMVVHPAVGNYDKTLVNALLYHCEGRLSSINGVVRPGIVHRIDKDTSGLLIVAKTDEAHFDLSAQLQAHSFKREYVAIVCGKMQEGSGTVDAPVGRHKTERKKMCVTSNHSKDAVTHYEFLQYFNKNGSGYTQLLCRLETGRTHQIRVHMAHLGYPVAGDPVYGYKKDKTGQKGQLLHAKTIGFVHPITKEYMEFSAALPTHMKNFIIKHGGSIGKEQE